MNDLEELIAKLSSEGSIRDSMGGYSEAPSNGYDPFKQLENLRAINRRAEERQVKDNYMRSLNSLTGAAQSGDDAGVGLALERLAAAGKAREGAVNEQLAYEDLGLRKQGQKADVLTRLKDLILKEKQIGNEKEIGQGQIGADMLRSYLSSLSAKRQSDVEEQDVRRNANEFQIGMFMQLLTNPKIPPEDKKAILSRLKGFM